MEENKITIRDLRHKSKFVVDDEYLNGYAKKCGIYATGVYMSLCRHANKEQKCWPSLKKIAEELAISPASVKRGIKKLEEYNIINKERKGKKLTNRYYLIDKSDWSGRAITDGSDRAIPSIPQSHHQGSVGAIHSKETQLKETQKKGEEAFDIFWKEYPKKIGKVNSWSKFNKLKVDDKLLRTILQDIEIRKTTAEWLKNNGMFIPYPATYINQRRWEDEDKGNEPIKKPHFAGDPIIESNGQKFVVKNGEWKKFAGSENDIEWK